MHALTLLASGLALAASAKAQDPWTISFFTTDDCSGPSSAGIGDSVAEPDCNVLNGVSGLQSYLASGPFREQPGWAAEIFTDTVCSGNSDNTSTVIEGICTNLQSLTGDPNGKSWMAYEVVSID